MLSLFIYTYLPVCTIPQHGLGKSLGLSARVCGVAAVHGRGRGEPLGRATMAQVQCNPAVRLLILIIYTLLLSDVESKGFLIYEEDSVRVLKTFDVSALRTTKQQILNLTHFIAHDPSARAFFETTSGIEHIILSITKETGWDATITIDLIDNILNSTKVSSRLRTRSIPWLGRAIHWVTGVAGPDEVSAFKTALHEIKNSLVSQNDFNNQLIKGQKYLHKVSNATNHLLGNMTDRISINIRRIRENKNENMATLNLLSLVSSLNILNKNARSQCIKIENIISTGSLGYLSYQAIPKNELEKVILKIQKQNPAYTPIFGIGDIRGYYTNKLTKFHMGPKTLALSLHVPLVDYQKRATIRVITKREKMMAFMDIFSYDYVAISHARDSYTFLTNSDLMGMLRIGHNYLYLKRKSTMLIHKKTCSELLPCGGIGDYVIHPITDNSFVVRIRHPVQVTLKCHNNKTDWTRTTHTIFHIKSSAIIMIPTNCGLDSKYFRIYESPPAKTITDGVIEFSIKYDHPMLNKLTFRNSSSFNISSWNAVIKDNNKNLKKLRDSNIDLEIKHKNMSAKVDKVVIGVASGGGALSFIAVVATLFCCCCCWANRHSLNLMP